MTHWQSIDQNALSLQHGSCHVWRLPVETDCLDICYAVLSTDEVQRAERFRFERDRRQSVVARGGLRYLLARYLAIDPFKLDFTYSAYQKPYIVDCPISFNVSHAGSWVVYIVSRQHIVGIDIECRRELDFLPLAKRFFSETEYRQLCELPADQLKAGFFHIWVQKEAFVKAVGSGLQYGLDQFSVAGLGHSGLVTDLREQWQLETFTMPGLYQAAYAIKYVGCDTQFYELSLAKP